MVNYCGICIMAVESRGINAIDYRKLDEKGTCDLCKEEFVELYEVEFDDQVEC